MPLTLSKQQELERTLATLKDRQRELAHQLAANPGAVGENPGVAPGDATLVQLLEVQAKIQTTEKALGLLGTAVQAFNAAQARIDRKTYLGDAVAARAAVQAALTSRQSAAVAADAAITALGTALDQMSAASKTASDAFDRWRGGVRSGVQGRTGDDPWEIGLGFVHTDLAYFAHVLAQRLDETLRTRIKTHPYLQFSYSETQNRTFAAVNTAARAAFDGVSAVAHARLQDAEAAA